MCPWGSAQLRRESWSEEDLCRRFVQSCPQECVFLISGLTLVHIAMESTLEGLRLLPAKCSGPDTVSVCWGVRWVLQAHWWPLNNKPLPSFLTCFLTFPRRTHRSGQSWIWSPSQNQNAPEREAGDPGQRWRRIEEAFCCLAWLR